MCEALKFDRPGQRQRIREDEVLADQLLLARVEASGGPRSMDVLTAWATRTRLQGIQLKRCLKRNGQRTWVSSVRRRMQCIAVSLNGNCYWALPRIWVWP